MAARSSADVGDVVVIGAGPAGLATSACLHHQGIPHVVLERAQDVAPRWRQHYDRLHLHTAKRCSGLPMTPWPRAAPRYPSRDDVVRYLADYAAEHGVTPRFGVAVRSVRRDGDHWTLQTQTERLTPRIVVMATGMNRVPRWPVIEGIDRFDGPCVHAADYRNPGRYRGLRTLVVGCGNSAAEIALDLAEAGVDVWLSVRGPVHVAPRDLFGWPAQHTAIALSRLPLGTRDAIAGIALRIAVGDLSRWGIERPADGPAKHLERTGRVPVLDIGTVAMIKAGRIRVVTGTQRVARRDVVFANGSMQRFDAIIIATGYDAALDELLGTTGSTVRDPPAAGLHFVGFRPTLTGMLREIAIDARRTALAIGAQLRSG